MNELVGAARWWALIAVVALLSAVAIWIISPRFQLVSPSFVDDWSAISKTSEQIAGIVRFQNSEEQRYRPGWIVWNYLQWHTFGASGLVAPNVWNVLLRLVVLVAGLSLMTALALPQPRSTRQSVLLAGLAGTPALLLLTVPKFGVDLARFGPQEPLLVGCMALGGSLLVLVAQALLPDERQVRLWTIGTLAIVGTLLWSFGAYQKETSLAALPLVACVVVAGRHRLETWDRLSAARRRALVSIGIVAALPILHLAVESGRIVARGDIVYDAEVAGGRGIVDGLRSLYDWSHEALPISARLLIIAAPLLTVVVAVLRRRVDLVAIGVLASAGVSLVLAAQSGVVATRYYLPVFALCSVAFVLALARLPRAVPAVGLVALVLYASASVAELSAPYVPVPGGREEVRLWAEREQRSAELLGAVTALVASGCIVAVAGLGEEEREALPVLVARERDVAAQRDCSGNVFFVVGPGDEGVSLASACAAGALTVVHDTSEVGVLEACASLRREPILDSGFGSVTPERLVELRRLSNEPDHRVG